MARRLELNKEDVLQDVLSRLEGVQGKAGYWMASCPAHEDSRASLSIGRGTTQPVVLNCHAGCDSRDILDAIGLVMSDISSGERTQDGTEWTPYGPATDVYQYRDDDGNLLYEVLRTASKQFPVRVPDGTQKSGYRWRMGDTSRVLYRNERLRAAIDDGEFIYVVEGEKDVHSIERTGAVATTSPGGAGKWLPAYSKKLTGAIVIVIADADQPGRKHARQVAESLEGIAAAVEVREAAEGKDVTDHLATGRTLADLIVTHEASPDVPAELALDLLTFVNQDDPDVRWVIPHMLERGDRLIWTGYEGLGKTTATRQISVCAAAGIQPFSPTETYPPQAVLYIDCENKVTRSRKWFRQVVGVVQGRYARLQPGMFRIVHRPDGIDLLKAEGSEFVLERVTAYRPDLIVIGPLYKLHDVDANEERAAGSVIRALEAAIQVCNSALIVEAHSPHGTPRSLRPRGSSIFLAWPDYGLGLKAQGSDATKVEIAPWRGSRDEDHRWPKELIRGDSSQLPWIAPVNIPSAKRAPYSPGYDD